MSDALLAEFREPAALITALRRIKQGGHRPLDAFTPYPVEGLDEELAMPASGIRHAMLVGGLGVAAAGLALQAYSAVLDYPFNSGGRPLFSWQVFLLVPFEVGVFAAALCGIIAFLWSCGLPRLHDPLFDIPAFERASQDHFFLLVAPEHDEAALDLRRALEAANAIIVTEVRKR